MKSIPFRIRAFCNGRLTQAAFAQAVGVSPSVVSQWISEARPIPVERCAVIEEVTGGEIRRWHIRPDDWHRIWPELIGAEGAPDVPRDQEVA